MFLLTASNALLITSLNAEQLIDHLPAELSGGWNRCIYFESNNIVCTDSSTPYIEETPSQPVNQFIYKKSFIINSDLQASTVGIWLDFVDDVDEVRVNNYLVGSIGQFPPYFQGGFRHKRLYLIPSVILKFNQFNHLKIRTFSSANKPGLSYRPVLLVNYLSYFHDQLEQDYIYIFSISILLLLTLFQFFYFSMVKGNNETLYLALFSVSLAFAAFTRSEFPLHIGLDLNAVYKAEMFMLNLGFIGINLFLFRFFQLEIRKIYFAGILLMSIPTLVNIIYPDPLAAREISETGYFVFCIASFFIGGNALYIAAIKRKNHFIPVASICVLGWLAMCFDAFTLSKVLIEHDYPMQPFILSLVTAFMSVSITLIVTHKYWGRFKGLTYDYNTGALLRPVFFQRLSQEVERSQKEETRLLVAVIQIQNFKKIAVNYGKEARDKILVTVSSAITKYLNPFDLVCFFDDGEFCIATTIGSNFGAQRHLNKLHHLIVQHLQSASNDTEFLAAVKIGGVIYDQERHLSISQLIQDANYCLEKVKTLESDDSVLLNNTLVNT